MKENAIRIPYPPKRIYPVLDVDGERLKVPTLLSIDPDDLDGEYQMLSSWSATISYQAMLCSVRVEKQERKIKELESEAYLKLLSSAAKKPSEGSLKANVALSAVVKAAYTELYKLMEDQCAWEALKQGMAAKKDMIVNLGASLRLDKKSAFS